MNPVIYSTLRLAVKRYPEIMPLLTGKAREIAMEFKKMERDPREPGVKRKLKFEKELSGLIKRVLARQAEMVERHLQSIYPSRTQKAGADIDLDWTEDEEAELVMLLIQASRDGIKLFSEGSKLPMDWEFANIEAAKWARKYAGNLIKEMTATSRAALRETIAAFIEMPGFTIGNVMEMLPFNEERALRVAVTEITRAYGEANQIAGQQLRKEFPDLKMIKTWYTNNDDLVCEYCGPLNGTSIPIDEAWDGEIQNPPYHVNCRCWTDYGTELSKE
jgi:hypothetical protein